MSKIVVPCRIFKDILVVSLHTDVEEFNKTNPEYKLHMVPICSGYRIEVNFGYKRNNKIDKEKTKDLVPAEKVGFEPTVPIKRRRFSKPLI